MTKIPTAEIHTPKELLSNASAMYETGDPKLFRGAILESITALEAFVQQTVFQSLEGLLDPLLVRWLENKTKMDFDSRLSVLAPIATGLPIDKSSKLWCSYKEAKQIRNEVVHKGRRVTKSDVDEVMSTVGEWLSYLSSTIELETALLELKKWIEKTRGLPILRASDPAKIVAQYFEKNAVGKTEIEPKIQKQGRHYYADLVLDLGPQKVLVETMIIGNVKGVRVFIEQSVCQVEHNMKQLGFEHAALIIFVMRGSEALSDSIQRQCGGRILLVEIDVRARLKGGSTSLQ